MLGKVREHGTRAPPPKTGSLKSGGDHTLCTRETAGSYVQRGKEKPQVSAAMEKALFSRNWRRTTGGERWGWKGGERAWRKLDGQQRKTKTRGRNCKGSVATLSFSQNAVYLEGGLRKNCRNRSNGREGEENTYAAWSSSGTTREDSAETSKQESSAYVYG